MKALILAAGKGTRLGHLTAEYPKPMLIVGEQPLLAHHVYWLRSHGVTQIAINLHHAPEVIPGYFGDGSAFGVEIVYSYEPDMLGTAGAAKNLEWFLTERFAVIYGDVFTNMNLGRLAAFHADRLQSLGVESGFSMSLYRVPNPTECGLVEVDSIGHVRRFVEKPPADQVFTDLANAGIVVCDPQILTWIPKDTVFDFGRDLLPKLIQSGHPVFGLPIAGDEYVIDIGTPAAFLRAQELATSLNPAVKT
ncbi:MAG: nucleotidyltransferase family protein [Caldilineaceae bacterium]|nr:nucleotidyltransferase family protein [Caldilineaceae bacterium]